MARSPPAPLLIRTQVTRICRLVVTETDAMIDANPTHFQPGGDLLAQARNLVALGEWPHVTQVLRTVLALNPALPGVRASYVDALLRIGDRDRARIAFEPLRGRADGDRRLSALGLAIDAAAAVADAPDLATLRAAVDGAPADPAARLRLAQWLLADRRWRPAMDGLLELVRIDRHYGDEAGRRALLAVFELCDDQDLVREYRRRLSSGLH